MKRADASDAVIERILRQSRSVAVVGLSPRPERDSYRVAAYLKQAGYRVVPVNPMADEILGERAYPSLSAIPEPVDLVDVFRRAEQIPALAEEVLHIGARCFWLQLGIRHAEAARRLRGAGIDVVEDRCVLVEHRRLAAPRAGL